MRKRNTGREEDLKPESLFVLARGSEEERQDFFLFYFCGFFSPLHVVK